MGDGGKLEKRNPGQDMKGFECQTKKFGQSSVGQAARGKSLKSKCDLVQMGWRAHWRPCSSAGGGDGHPALGRTIGSDA